MLWLWCMLSWAQVATVDGVPLPEAEFAVRARHYARFNALDLRARKHVVDEMIDERLFARRALEIGVQNDPDLQRLIVRAWYRRHVADAAEHITDEELRAWWDAQAADPFPGPPRSFEERQGLIFQRVREERLAARKERWLRTLRDDARIVVDKRFLRLHGPLPYKVRKAKLGDVLARFHDEPITELPPLPPVRHGELPTLPPEQLASMIDERLVERAALAQPLLDLPEVRRELADIWLSEQMSLRVDDPKMATTADYDRVLGEIREDVRRGVEIVIDERYLARVPVRASSRIPPRPLIPPQR